LPPALTARRPALLLALAAAVWLIPNEPSARWYAVPEIVCGLFQSDENQWRCDETPVAWAPHVAGQR
jgi:hypothetical protein